MGCSTCIFALGAHGFLHLEDLGRESEVVCARRSNKKYRDVSFEHGVSTWELGVDLIRLTRIWSVAVPETSPQRDWEPSRIY